MFPPAVPPQDTVAASEIAAVPPAWSLRHVILSPGLPGPQAPCVPTGDWLPLTAVQLWRRDHVWGTGPATERVAAPPVCEQPRLGSLLPAGSGRGWPRSPASPRSGPLSHTRQGRPVRGGAQGGRPHKDLGDNLVFKSSLWP